jgi:hypothetical protein
MLMVLMQAGLLVEMDDRSLEAELPYRDLSVRQISSTCIV